MPAFHNRCHGLFASAHPNTRSNSLWEATRLWLSAILHLAFFHPFHVVKGAFGYKRVQCFLFCGLCFQGFKFCLEFGKGCLFFLNCFFHGDSLFFDLIVSFVQFFDFLIGLINFCLSVSCQHSPFAVQIPGFAFDSIVQSLTSCAVAVIFALEGSHFILKSSQFRGSASDFLL